MAYRHCGRSADLPNLSSSLPIASLARRLTPEMVEPVYTCTGAGGEGACEGVAAHVAFEKHSIATISISLSPRVAKEAADTVSSPRGE